MDIDLAPPMSMARTMTVNRNETSSSVMMSQSQHVFATTAVDLLRSCAESVARRCTLGQRISDTWLSELHAEPTSKGCSGIENSLQTTKVSQSCLCSWQCDGNVMGLYSGSTPDFQCQNLSCPVRLVATLLSCSLSPQARELRVNVSCFLHTPLGYIPDTKGFLSYQDSSGVAAATAGAPKPMEKPSWILA